MRACTLFASILLLLSVRAEEVAAQDRPRAAVLDLDGRMGGPATRLVRRALEAHAEVVDADDALPEDAAGRAELARRLDVALLVAGEVGGTRRRTQLRLRFYDASGEERHTEAGRLRRGGRGRRDLRRLVASAFEALGPLEPPPPEPEPVEEAPPPAASDDEAPPALQDADEGDADDEDDARGDRYRPWLRVRAGISTRNRHLEVEGDVDVRHSIDLYPELLADVVVRPLAFLADDALYGVRVRARFEYALFWESADPMGNVFGGTQYGFSADAGYLAPLGDVVELGGSLGGGYSAYQLDPNDFVPSVDYAHFEARAATRIRAFDELLILSAELGYRYASGSGALPDAFGALEGNGVVFVGGIGGTFLVEPSLGIDYGFELQWQRVWFSFGDDVMNPATGGSEELVRGRFLVGVSVQ